MIFTCYFVDSYGEKDLWNCYLCFLVFELTQKPTQKKRSIDLFDSSLLQRQQE